MRPSPWVLASFLLLAACGTDTVEGPGGPPEPRDAEWVAQELPAERGADSGVVVHSGGQGVLVATTSEDGVMSTHWSQDGYDFEAGEPVATDLAHFQLGGVAPVGDDWVALGSGGLEEVDGDGELLFEVAALHSDDGLSWTREPVNGFTGPADVAGVVQVGDGLVAAGSYRGPEDPAMGGFRAVAWTSDDGVSWREVLLPGDGGESSVADLAVSGDRVLAVGQSGGDAVLWVSDDAGARWSTVDAPELEAWMLVGVAADGDTVVVTAEDDGTRFVVSDDAGATWRAASEPPVTEGTEGFAPVWSGGGRFFSVTSSFLESWSQPEVCYADITLCQQDSRVVLHASDDGDTWTPVDTSGIGSGEEGEVDEALGTVDGAVVVLKAEGGLAAYTWPAGRELPTTGVEEVPRAELVEVPAGGPEVGVRYHVPLYLHCGTEWLYLGDQPWQVVGDAPEVETGAGDVPPEGWPVAQQTLFGYATLVDEETLEYTLEDGELVARYARTRQQPPGCD